MIWKSCKECTHTLRVQRHDNFSLWQQRDIATTKLEINDNGNEIAKKRTNHFSRRIGFLLFFIFAIRFFFSVFRFHILLLLKVHLFHWSTLFCIFAVNRIHLLMRLWSFNNKISMDKLQWEQISFVFKISQHQW